MSFSADFKVTYADPKEDKFDIIIEASQRVLSLNAQRIEKLVVFIYFLQKAIKESDFFQFHRFKSFANIHEKCHSEYFVDGAGYYASMHDAILNAKK